jgi:hypothetical protein
MNDVVNVKYATRGNQLRQLYEQGEHKSDSQYIPNILLLQGSTSKKAYWYEH